MLCQIEYFGFDYTFAEYISPEFDQLGCVLAQQHLVTARGYSPAILDIQYDPTFPVRGLWYDKLKGNLPYNRLSTSSISHLLRCREPVES